MPLKVVVVCSKKNPTKKQHSCPCVLSSRCQQAERRPQTRADSESYEKARDYFSEGKSIFFFKFVFVSWEMTTHGAHLNFIWVSCRALILTLLHPCSAETAARWWLFQESSLPWLPVSHDPRPHQPLPIQRLAVSQRKNSKCPCALLIRSHPHLFFFSSLSSFLSHSATRRKEDKKQQQLVRKSSLCDMRPPYPPPPDWPLKE